MTCCTVVGSFLPMPRIKTLVLCLEGNSSSMEYFILLKYVTHVMIITITSNDTDWISPWWKCYCCFKYIIFNEGDIREINFIFGRSDVYLPLKKMEQGDHPLTNLLLCSPNVPDG